MYICIDKEDNLQDNLNRKSLACNYKTILHPLCLNPYKFGKKLCLNNLCIYKDKEDNLQYYLNHKIPLCNYIMVLNSIYFNLYKIGKKKRLYNFRTC